MKEFFATTKLRAYHFVLTYIFIGTYLLNPYYPKGDFFRRYEFRDILIYVFSFLFIIAADSSFRRSLKDRSKVIWSALLSSIFSFFMLVGPTFTEKGSIELVKNQMAKSILIFCGFLIVIWYLLLVVFDILEIILESKKELELPSFAKKYVDWLKKKPFLTTFITLLIIYIPFAILAYPADFMGDADEQLEQGFNMPSYTHYGKDYGDIKLDNHHPVLHTLFLTNCVKLGKAIFNSYNAGVFIYAVIQCIFMLACFAYMEKTLVESKMSDAKLLFVPLYAVFGVHFVRYMFLTSKDVIYAGFLLLFMCEMYYILKNKGIRPQLFAFIVGSLLFRKDAVYMIIILFMVMIILNCYSRKKLIGLLAFAVIVHVLWNSVLLPAAGVHKGSKREMFSLPFQMTARYVRDLGDQVTDEEREAIDAVLQYDELAEAYNPIHSSPVKSKYREDATKEDLRNYFKAFTQMFFKHPNVYLYAFLEFKAYMFYPGKFRQALYSYSNSAEIMAEATGHLQELGISFSYPDSALLAKIRARAEKIQKFCVTLPIVSATNSAAFYTWISLIIAAFAIIKRNGKVFSLITPALVVILLCIAGPRSSLHFRYYFPLVVTLPFMVIFAFDVLRDARNDR